MRESQNYLFELAMVVLFLFAVYIVALFTIRYVLKVKRDYTVEAKVRNKLPIWFRYLYIILLIGALVGYLFFHIGFGLFLVLLLLLANQVITSVVALKILEDKKQKYYHYCSIIFNSIAIIAMIAMVILDSI